MDERIGGMDEKKNVILSVTPDSVTDSLEDTSHSHQSLERGEEVYERSGESNSPSHVEPHSSPEIVKSTFGNLAGSPKGGNEDSNTLSHRVAAIDVFMDGQEFMGLEDLELEEENLYTKVEKKKSKKGNNTVGVSTRNRAKEDVGMPKGLGKKSTKWHREHECIQKIVDGTQKTILDLCRTSSKK